MTIPPLTALIFMKGHSARVPRKNMRPICGKPLCHWILETLAKCAYIKQIVVNTDSTEIAESVAPLAKVKIHERPAHLLGDFVNVNQIIEWDLNHSDGDFYFQTHSTNPLLTVDSIERGIAAFFSQKEHDALFSVTEVKKRYYWPDGRGINHDPANLLPTQHLPPIYEENSCFYIFNKETFLRTRQRLGKKPMMFSIPAIEAVDIDEMVDFMVAEALLKALRKEA